MSLTLLEIGYESNRTTACQIIKGFLSRVSDLSQDKQEARNRHASRPINDPKGGISNRIEQR